MFAVVVVVIVIDGVTVAIVADDDVADVANVAADVAGCCCT